MTMERDMWAGLLGHADISPRLARAWLDGLGVNRAAPADVLISLFDTGETDFPFRRDLPHGVVDAAVGHTSKRVRGLASETGLTAGQWEKLIAATPESHLRRLFTELAAEEKAARGRSRGGRGVGLAPHPDAVAPATPQEIAMMAAEVPDIGPDDHSKALWWIGALHGDADAMRQLAASPKLLIRRSVARAPHLPEDVVTLLSQDDDRVVRLFLAESCDDAPAEMLLDVCSWWQGSLSFPGRPRNHPNFPRTGLLRFAEDRNPQMRQLALDDPASSSELVELFSRDESAEIRQAAAADARLSPETAARLAADPDHVVRYIARAHPALPTDVLVSLLAEQHSARDAARNPAIPVTVMRHMIEVAAGADPIQPR